MAILPSALFPNRGRAVAVPELAWLLPLAILVGTLLIFLSDRWGAAAVTGTAALLIVLVKPEFSLYLLIFAVPFGSLADFPVGPLSLSAAEPLILVGVLSWAARAMAGRESRVVFTRLSWPLALFVGVLVLSATTAISIPLGLKEAAKWLEMLIVFLLVANSIVQRRQLAAIYVCLAVAASLEALLGWYQFLARSGPEGFLIGERFLRAFGTFGQPNPYAGYLVFVLCLLGGLIITALAQRRTVSLSLKAAGVASLIMLAAILMSLSRGGMLALFAALCVMAILASRRALGYLLLGLFVLGVLLTLGAFQLLPSEVTQRLSVVTSYFTLFDAREVILTPENWAIVERMANWQAAWQMFLSNPILGTGIGNFSLVYPSFALPQWEVPTIHAHNFYLTLLAESGILGLGGYLAFLVGSFLFAGRALARRVSDGADTSFISSRGVIIGVIGAMIALSVHNFLDNLYVHSMSAQVGLALGLVAVTGREHPESEAV